MDEQMGGGRAPEEDWIDGRMLEAASEDMLFGLCGKGRQANTLTYTHTLAANIFKESCWPCYCAV